MRGTVSGRGPRLPKLRDLCPVLIAPPPNSSAETGLSTLRAVFLFPFLLLALVFFFLFFLSNGPSFFFCNPQGTCGVTVGGWWLHCQCQQPLLSTRPLLPSHNMLNNIPPSFFFSFSRHLFFLPFICPFDFTFQPLIAVRYQGYRSMTHS